MTRSGTRLILGLLLISALAIALLTACQASLADRLHAMQDPDPAIRCAAVRHLAKMNHPAAAEAVGYALEDRHVDVVLAAIAAVKKTVDANTLHRLAALLTHDDSAVRYAAKSALQALGPAAAKGLHAAIDLRNPHQSVALAQVLGAMKDPGGTNALIQLLAADVPADVRRQAIRSLGQQQSPQATDALTALLGKTETSLSTAAADALVEIGPPATSRVLELLTAADQEAAISAADILGRIGDHRAVAPLVELLQKHEDDGLRWSAAEALGRIGHPQAIKPLVKALSDSFPPVAAKAADALVGVGAKAVPALVSQMRGRRNQNAKLATSSLGKMGRPAAEAVVPLLTDPDSDIRKRAQQTIAAIGTPAIEPLFALVDGEDLVARESALGLLTAMGAPVVEGLVERIDTPQEPLRNMLASRLVAIGKPAVAPLLSKFSGKGKLPGRKAAAEILGQLGDVKAVEPLKAALLDLQLASTAAQALEKLQWQPVSMAQKVYYHVARRDRTQLMPIYEDARQLLITDLGARKPQLVRHSVDSLLWLEAQTAPAQIMEVLYGRGSSMLAEALVDCKHPELQKAGALWKQNYGR